MSEVVRVEKMIPGGRGFARMSDGRPVLLTGGFPGERVRLHALRDRGSFVEAVAELEEGGELRVEPPCSVAATCGGCDWMALRLEEQRSSKVEIVREALRRTGGFPEVGDIELVTAGEPLGYRSRVRLKIRAGRVGFHVAGSHDLVEPAPCLVAAPPVQRALSVLRERLRGVGSAGDVLSHVEVRCASGAARASLCFGREGGQPLPAPVRALLGDLARDFLVVVDGEGGSEVERFDLEGCYLLAAPGSFTQVNWAVNRVLVRAVVAGAKERQATSFADLYCGAGNFSLPLAAAGLRGRGVEANAASIACARRAALEQGLTRVELETGDVRRVAKRWSGRGERFDLVVVDPPRAGARGVLDAIATLSTRAVAMVSCDPATFARDLRGLVDRGWALDRVIAFDMFPQTHHVESLAWLRR